MLESGKRYKVDVYFFRRIYCFHHTNLIEICLSYEKSCGFVPACCHLRESNYYGAVRCVCIVLYFYGPAIQFTLHS